MFVIKVGTFFLKVVMWNKLDNIIFTINTYFCYNSLFLFFYCLVLPDVTLSVVIMVIRETPQMISSIHLNS